MIFDCHYLVDKVQPSTQILKDAAGGWQQLHLHHIGFSLQSFLFRNFYLKRSLDG